jgi:hypothetical protein
VTKQEIITCPPILNKKNFILTVLLIFHSLSYNYLHGQDTKEESPFTFSGYAEIYYIYDFNKPSNHERPSFIYSFNRHNEVNLNLGFLSAAYQADNVRAHLSLMTGTYANANLAAEPGVLKNILEANAGVKLSSKHDLWLDAGIFSSHIGFESAVGALCWNMTRSIMAENSPYYESGAKISYSSNNEKWFLSAMILNGWQRIQRVDGNNTPAFGHQVIYAPNAHVTLNSSSFIGSDSPDSLRQMRYFHNFFGQFQLTPRFAFIAGFDIGAQQESKGSSDYDIWFTPVGIARYAVSERISISIRGEYYSDKNQVIISTGTPNGFQTAGLSANFDYLINKSVLWRIEARNLNSKDPIFEKSGDQTDSNFILGTSLSVTF